MLRKKNWKRIWKSTCRVLIDKHGSNPAVGQTLGMLQMKQGVDGGRDSHAVRIEHCMHLWEGSGVRIWKYRSRGIYINKSIELG